MANGGRVKRHNHPQLKMYIEPLKRPERAGGQGKEASKCDTKSEEFLSELAQTPPSLSPARHHTVATVIIAPIIITRATIVITMVA